MSDYVFRLPTQAKKRLEWGTRRQNFGYPEIAHIESSLRVPLIG